jgi:hypothetical protein
MALGRQAQDRLASFAARNKPQLAAWWAAVETGDQQNMASRLRLDI